VLVTARAAAILLLVVLNIARMLVVRELGRAVNGGVSFRITVAVLVLARRLQPGFVPLRERRVDTGGTGLRCAFGALAALSFAAALATAFTAALSAAAVTSVVTVFAAVITLNFGLVAATRRVVVTIGLHTKARLFILTT